MAIFGKKDEGSEAEFLKVRLRPHLTEKAVSQDQQYIFKVAKQASKPMIRKVVEEMYGVDVVDVRTINIPRKKKRFGATEGWKSGYKKAVVRIEEGQNIDL